MSAAITIKMSEAIPARETGIGLFKICQFFIRSIHLST